jgi:hypothetical protein
VTGTYDLRVSASENPCRAPLRQRLLGGQLSEGVPWFATLCPGGGATSARLALVKPSVAPTLSCNGLEQDFLVGMNAMQKQRVLICGKRYGLLS